MNYCVLAHISKSTISFWYQQQGVSFEPLADKEGNTLPLFFYANGNEFILGSTAREKYLNGDQVKAFGNYFEIIKNPSSFFTVYGDKKHVKFLLYYAIEKYLTHFITSILIKQESIEGYRNNFPLRFTFSNDIAQKEKLLVEEIFKESGYHNIESVSYTHFLLTFLSHERFITPQQPIILLTGIDGNLFVELFSKSFANSINYTVVEDQGADPRIKIMAKMIYDDAMAAARLSLNEKNELNHLLPFAEEFLSQDSAIPHGDITLSDGTPCWVKIKKKDLNEQLVYYSGEEKIFKAIEKLLSENGLAHHEVQFVLNGDAVNTQYFIDRLKKKYSNVVGTPPVAQNETLKLIFKNISDFDYKVNCSLKKINSCQIESLSFELPSIVQESNSAGIPPKINTPPVVKVPPRINTPPVVKTPPRISTPPNVNGSTRVNIPPILNVPPKLKTPSVNIPPVVNMPPKIAKPPLMPKPPENRPPPPPPVPKKNS